MTAKRHMIDDDVPLRMWRNTAHLVVAVVCAVVLPGCAPGTGGNPSRPPSDTPGQTSASLSNTDPCAMRLHDISGAILLYFLEHRDLPPTLDDLPELPGIGKVAELMCPESGAKYLYNPAGLARDPQGLMVILADAVSAHAGMRWCISIEEPRPGAPLITRVVALPPSAFVVPP